MFLCVNNITFYNNLIKVNFQYSTGRIFIEFYIWGFFENLWRKFEVILVRF